MIVIIILSVAITLFEVSFREIILLSNICLLFLLVNVLYWFKRYKFAVPIGFISGLLIDLMLQNRFGETILSLFAPLLLLSFFDNLLQVEGRVSRMIFSIVGTISSIFISDFLLKLLFWEGNLDFSVVVERITVSAIICMVVVFVFGRFLQSEENEGKYL